MVTFVYAVIAHRMSRTVLSVEQLCKASKDFFVKKFWVNVHTCAVKRSVSDLEILVENCSKTKESRNAKNEK